MHYLIFVLAEGESQQDASEAALSVLDQYQDQVFDYRCDGAQHWDEFPASSLSDRTRFDAQLERARDSRKAGIAMHLASMASSLKLECPDGSGIDAMVAPSREQMQALGAAAFTRLHAQLFDGVAHGLYDGLAGYSMKRITQLAQGDFVLDGHFLNATDRFGDRGDIPSREQLDDALTAGASLWIVPVDVHS